MTDNLPALIDRLGAAAVDCRAAIREAHEATSDLRDVLKEARKLLSGDDIRDRISDQVEAELGYLHTKTQETCDVAVARITEQLTRIVGPLVKILDGVDTDLRNRLLAAYVPAPTWPVTS
jgi:hypothetical protein